MDGDDDDKDEGEPTAPAVVVVEPEQGGLHDVPAGLPMDARLPEWRAWARAVEALVDALDAGDGPAAVRAAEAVRVYSGLCPWLADGRADA